MEQYTIDSFKKDLEKFEELSVEKRIIQERMKTYLNLSMLDTSTKDDSSFVVGCKNILRSKFKSRFKALFVKPTIGFLDEKHSIFG
jgi:hypothetical protein